MGEISKKWRGWCAESFTDSDNFKIEFPTGADVTTKAILMGATMLVVSSCLYNKYIIDLFAFSGLHVF